MLEDGHDSPHLRILAGELPPYHHFELAHLRDRALSELGIQEVSDTVAVHLYAIERLRVALTGQEDLIETVALLKDLCIAHDYPHRVSAFEN
jgi:hypothetical protein